MSELKLELCKEIDPRASHAVLRINDCRLVLPKDIAKEVYHRAEAYENAMELLTYWYELASEGTRHSKHLEMIAETDKFLATEQALKEKPNG